MPAYNGAATIRETLKALLGQDFADFELHISDDASSDGTLEICEEFAAADSRVRLHRARINQGATANFNRAFSYCRTEYFMFAADNDIREPSFISSCLSALRRTPRSVLSFCYFDTLNPGGDHGPVIDDRMDTLGLGQRARLSHVLANLDWCSAIYGLMRADALRSTRLFRNIWGMDLAVMYQLSLLGDFVKVPAVLLHRVIPGGEPVPRRKQWEGFAPGNKNQRVFLPDIWLMVELLTYVSSLHEPPSRRLLLTSDIVRFAAGRLIRRVQGSSRFVQKD
jgi:glycosyltransferase involved in cell wall biosynthesis